MSAEEPTSRNDRERLLEHEQQKLAAILSNGDTAFVVIDDANRVLWVNDLFRERFTREDHDPDELRGMTCNQVLCGRSTRCESCPCVQSIASGKVEHHELRLWIRDRFQQIYLTAMPVRSPGGEREQTMVMLQDVSDLRVLRRSEEAFRASERRFRSIFDGVAAGMATIKLDGSLLQVNPAFSTMLGHTGSELLGRPFVEMLEGADRETMRQLFDEVRAGERQVIELELRFRRRDETTLWAQTRAVLQFDPDQKPTYLVAMIQDITQRKQAQRGLEQSKRRYQTLVNSIDGIVWETDADSPRFTFVSDNAEKILGFPTEQWLTQPRFWRNRLHTDDLQRVVEAYGSGVGNRSSFEVEYRMIAADGTDVWLRDTVTVAEDEDGKVRLCGLMVDVTKRKRAEEALQESEEHLRQSQKMEAISRLAGGVAHDFNNLLTTISGYADLIRRGLDEGHALTQEAAEVARAAERAGELTGQLMAFSRQQVMQPEVFRLNQAVADQEGSLRELLGGGIRLELDLDPELGAVRTDPDQMRQVVQNLVLNARDAMPAGGDLTLATANVTVTDDNAYDYPGMPTGSWAMLRVSDTGKGMDTTTQARLFEPFFTTKQGGHGAGMGLATVYGIVTQSEGIIRVESEPDDGSTFTVFLPIAAAGEEEPVSRVRPARQLPDFTTGSETVLLVEDDTNVRELARRVLEMSGYMVIEASNGVEALSMCRSDSTPVDLLATDLAMPEMDGTELAERIETILPGLKVLFLSGYPGEELVADGRLDPESPFLQKPFTPARLSAKVREVLDG